MLLSESCTSPEPIGPPSVGFYHWRQQLQVDSLNECLQSTYGLREIPVKVLDVGWRNDQPEALFRLEVRGDSLPQLTPVVFITNEVMRRADEGDLRQLVDKLIGATEEIMVAGGAEPANIREWQIDCDWTAGTRGKYFFFLETLKAQLPPEAELSATIRLHQFLNQRAQGIPPVDRGVLMVYNVGELDDPTTVNSILDTSITLNYLRKEVRYPIDLDIALPFYQWGVVYRDGQLVYLLNEFVPEEADQVIGLLPAGPNRYRVRETAYWRGNLLYQGDLIRLERPDSTSLLALAKQLRIIPRFPGQRLLFYHLDSQLAAGCDTALINAIVSTYCIR